MSRISVSIIVPVYNAAAHLRECVESILGQTLKDIEVILVDDGSTDESGTICDEFAQRDARVRVIHNQNGGPALARNSGIKAARGEFIGFVDADDFVSPEMFLSLYSAAVSSGSDMAFCDYIAQKKSGSVSIRSDYSGDKTYNKEEIEKLVLPYFFGYADGELKAYKSFCPFADYSSYIWLCIYKTSVIRAFDLNFPDQKIYYNEDHLFNLSFVFHASKISHVAKFLYFYRDCEDSLTKQYCDGFLDAKLNRFAYMREFIKSNGCDPSLNRRLDNKICVETINIINYYVNAGALGMHEKYEKIRRTLDSEPIENAYRALNLKSVPFSKLSVILRLAKHKRYRTLLLLSQAYNLVRR